MNSGRPKAKKKTASCRQTPMARAGDAHGGIDANGSATNDAKRASTRPYEAGSGPVETPMKPPHTARADTSRYGLAVADI
jgi:hypothetical protein